MRFTEIGTDLVIINEANLSNKLTDDKIHLIKFGFEHPTEEKIRKVLDTYPETNRFVVGNYVKEYNFILRDLGKKYYIQNVLNRPGLISFMRKNNKVFLSIPSLTPEEKSFVLSYALEDILKNLEIIMINIADFEKLSSKFKNWNGNVVLWKDENEYL
ncbi:MAG: hypothetical protein WC503_04135 [Candidatus Shapirobacteria bacterium]